MGSGIGLSDGEGFKVGGDGELPAPLWLPVLLGALFVLPVALVLLVVFVLPPGVQPKAKKAKHQ